MSAMDAAGDPKPRIRPAALGDAASVAATHVASWRAGYAGQLPDDFLAWDYLTRVGLKLTDAEKRQRTFDAAAWMLSQFLHGEQGALFAAAQVTESVPFVDGKFYGATQVVVGGRLRLCEVAHHLIAALGPTLARIAQPLRWGALLGSPAHQAPQ